MAIHYFKGDIGTAGTASAKAIMHGQIAAIRLAKTGANNPVVTFKENSGATQTVLNGVTVSAETRYYPRVAVQDNAAAARLYAASGTAVSDRYQVDGEVELSCTGGSNGGTIEGWIQTYD